MTGPPRLTPTVMDDTLPGWLPGAPPGLQPVNPATRAMPVCSSHCRLFISVPCYHVLKVTQHYTALFAGNLPKRLQNGLLLKVIERPFLLRGPPLAADTRCQHYKAEFSRRQRFRAVPIA